MNSIDLQARNQQNRHGKMVPQLFDPKINNMINGKKCVNYNAHIFKYMIIVNK